MKQKKLECYFKNNTPLCGVLFFSGAIVNYSCKGDSLWKLMKLYAGADSGRSSVEVTIHIRKDETYVAWTSIWSFFRKKNFNKDFPIIMSYAFAAAKEKMIGAGDINVQSMIA